MSRVIALNDGDTYTGAEGCRIVEVPDGTDDVESYLKEGPEGVLYEFAGTEVVAFTADERDAIAEAILYLEESGDGKYKDDLGRLVPKRKRERVLAGIADKLGL